MAVISLHQVWINLLSTGESVVAYSTDRAYARASDGGVRKYAGGRLRNISSAGTTGQFNVKLRDVTQPQLNTLDAWKEQEIQFRDHRGRKIFGVFHALAITERKVVSLYDVSLVIEEITYNEAV